MILLVHMLLGALIGQRVLSPVFAIILAFLSHYFLDLFPHIEYNLKDTKKILLDFLLGILLLSAFSKNQPILYICAFFAILPDGFTVLSYFVNPKFLQLHDNFHRKKIHFLRDKKISFFWRVLSQAIVVIMCLILFKV